MSKKKCPICLSGELVHTTKRETYTYKDISIYVDQPGMYCGECGESVLSGEDLKATRQAIHDLHAKGDGLLISSEVKRIREKIGFTQKRAGEFFGGGVNAFSRYERGETRQSKAIDLLLRLFDARPELLSSFHFDGYISVLPEHTPSWRSFSSVKENFHMQVLAGMSAEFPEKLTNMHAVNDNEPQLKMVVNG